MDFKDNFDSGDKSLMNCREDTMFDLTSKDAVPPQQSQPTVVVTSQVGSVSNGPSPNYYPQPVAVGPYSTELNCPHCRCRIKTRIRHKATTKTHCMCLLLFWTGICCCLPYCIGSCQNTNHFCPMCGAYIGTYQS